MLLTKEELGVTAQIHPQIAELYQRNPRPERKFDIHVYRAYLRKCTEASLSRLGPTPAGILEMYHDIQMRDGYSSSLKIFRPSHGPPGPLLVLFFGGGFIAGDNDQLTETARISVELFGATVVNISYRVAPEFKFPLQQLDCWDSVEWIANNATGAVLAANPSKGFVLGGISAGASIAAALSRGFQVDKQAHPLTGQWLAVPSIMDGNCCPEEYKESWISNDQNANTPVLSREVAKVIYDAAAWDTTSELKYAANSKTNMSDQPRTYTQVCGMDPLRDDGLIYDEMLQAAGVQTKLDLYPGCPHAYWSQIRGVEIANKAFVDTIVGLGWLLEIDVSREQAAEALGLPRT